jgi:hypothetical protein
MNLAPLRYARILAQPNGPLERLEYGRVEVCGRVMYQAHAHLSERLNLRKGTAAVFDAVDGTGTHPVAMVARHLAISEAMERWALYFLRQGGLDRYYGLDLDPWSTGLAAYPGLWRRQARTHARREAIERYCLVGWWKGELGGRALPTPLRDVEALELHNPLSRDPVVMTWQQIASRYWAYGFACGRWRQTALNKALVEMARAGTALGRFFRANPGFHGDDLEAIADPLERRVLYYALPEGHRLFRERVDQPRGPSPGRPPEPVVDSHVPGPWDRYATVWRVLYPMPTLAYLNPHLDWFYW